MASDSMSVWEKFDIEEYKLSRYSYVPPTFDNGDPPEPISRRIGSMNTKWFWTVLDAVAIVFWFYVVIKLFLVDIDRWAVARFSPSGLWILDYRFIIILVLLTIVFLIAKQWKIAVSLLYIWMFPFVF